VLASPYLHRSKTEESRCEVNADPQADAMPAPIGNPAPPSAPGVAGFKSERWPTSNRKGGRLQIGKGGRFASESAEIDVGNRQLPAVVFTENEMRRANRHSRDKGRGIRRPYTGTVFHISR
jgi:hypothetical protein